MVGLAPHYVISDSVQFIICPRKTRSKKIRPSLCFLCPTYKISHAPPLPQDRQNKSNFQKVCRTLMIFFKNGGKSENLGILPCQDGSVPGLVNVHYSYLAYLLEKILCWPRFDEMKGAKIWEADGVNNRSIHFLDSFCPCENLDVFLFDGHFGPVKRVKRPKKSI